MTEPIIVDAGINLCAKTLDHTHKEYGVDFCTPNRESLGYASSFVKNVLPKDKEIKKGEKEVHKYKGIKTVSRQKDGIKYSMTTRHTCVDGIILGTKCGYSRPYVQIAPVDTSKGMVCTRDDDKNMTCNVISQDFIKVYKNCLATAEESYKSSGREVANYIEREKGIEKCEKTLLRNVI